MSIKDKIEHCILCFIATAVGGIRLGIEVAILVEAVQAESIRHNESYKDRIIKFFSHFKRSDTWGDFLADAIGILLGSLTRFYILKRNP